jgi:flagellar biosynthetic protein FliR
VNISIDFTWLEAVMLAGVRMVAFIVVAPPFSFNAFPLRIKGMLAVGLALAVAPRVVPGYASPDTGGFVLALLLEIVVGGVLGFLVLVVFAAIQSAGNLIDLFGGFQLAQGFDPQSMVNGAQFTRLYQMTALALLFASGGYQLILGGLARSFTAWPVGGGIDLAVPMQAITSAVGQMLLASVQIAGPLIVVLFLADAGLGLLTRVAPALNAFALGFPLKILLTLMLASTAFLALPQLVARLTGDATTALMGVTP